MEKFKVDKPQAEDVCRNVAMAISHHLRNPNMLDKNRQRENVKARQITHYCLHELTNISLGDIGMYVSEQDHATVLHSSRTVVNDSRDQDYAWDVTNCLGIAESVIYQTLDIKNPKVSEIKEKIAALRSHVNGNEYGQKAISFLENVIRERVPGYIV